MSVRNILFSASGIFNKLSSKYWILDISNSFDLNYTIPISGFYYIPAEENSSSGDKIFFSHTNGATNAFIYSVDVSGRFLEAASITDYTRKRNFTNFHYNKTNGYNLLYNYTEYLNGGYLSRTGIVKFTNTNSLVYDKSQASNTGGKNINYNTCYTVDDKIIVVGVENINSTKNSGFFSVYDNVGNIIKNNYLREGAIDTYSARILVNKKAGQFYLSANDSIVCFNLNDYSLLWQTKVAKNIYGEMGISKDEVTGDIVTMENGNFTVLNPINGAIKFSKTISNPNTFNRAMGNCIEVYGTSISDTRYYFLTNVVGSYSTYSFVLISYNPNTNSLVWCREFRISNVYEDNYFLINSASLIVNKEGIFIKILGGERSTPIIVKYPLDGSIMGTFDTWVIEDINYFIIKDNATAATTISTGAVATNTFNTTVDYYRGIFNVNGSIKTSLTQ